MYTKEDVMRMEEESSAKWKAGDVQGAFEINTELSKAFPQSYMFRMRCMSNLIQMKRLDEAKEIYNAVLEKMKVDACGWKLFEEDEKMQYMFPLHFIEGFFRSCLAAGYYNELKEEAMKVIDFYCKSGIGIQSSPKHRDINYTLPNGLSAVQFFDEFFEIMRSHGVDVPKLQDTINEFHKKCEEENQTVVNIIEECKTQDSYAPLAPLVEDGSVYVLDKYYTYHEFYLNANPKFELKNLYGCVNNSNNKRAIVAFSTIKGAVDTSAFGTCRQIKMGELIELMLLDENYEAVLLKYLGENQWVIPMKIFKPGENS